MGHPGGQSFRCPTRQGSRSQAYQVDLRIILREVVVEIRNTETFVKEGTED